MREISPAHQGFKPHPPHQNVENCREARSKLCACIWKTSQCRGKGFADHYKDAGVFNNALYGFITAIVGVVACVGAFVATALAIVADIGITDWTNVAEWTAAITIETAFTLFGGIILAIIVLFIFAILTAWFYRRSLSLLASKSRVGLFRTAGLLLLIGAVLTIIVLGFLLIWISFLIIAIAFFSIRPTVAEPTPQSPPS